MPTEKARDLAEEIHRVFITTRDFDNGMYEIATLIDIHTKQQVDAALSFDRAVGSMFDSQHDTPYGQE